jgi:hypothetical protein
MQKDEQADAYDVKVQCYSPDHNAREAVCLQCHTTRVKELEAARDAVRGALRLALRAGKQTADACGALAEQDSLDEHTCTALEELQCEWDSVAEQARRVLP